MEDGHHKNFQEFCKLEMCSELLKEIIKINEKEKTPNLQQNEFRNFRSQFFNTDANLFSYKLSGKLKTEISDFRVTEILQDGSKAEFNTQEVPDYDKKLIAPKTQSEILPEVLSDLNTKLDLSLSLDTIMKVINGEEESLTLTSPNLENKQTRTFVHERVRDLECLDSVTKDNNTILVTKFKTDKSKIKAMKRKQPGYLIATLKKESISHFDAIYKIARILKIHEAIIGTSGIKDKYAITLQRISIKNMTASKVLSVLPELKQVTEDRVDLGNFSYSNSKIAMGDHYGNSFKIKIRNVEDLNEEKFDLEKVFEKTEGYFVNYYGDQRFGSKIFSSDKRGKLLLKRRFLKFVANLYFFENVVNDFGVPSEREIKVKESYKSLQKLDFTEIDRLLGERRKTVNDYILKMDNMNDKKKIDENDTKGENGNDKDKNKTKSKTSGRKKEKKEEIKLKDKDMLPEELLNKIEEKANELYQILDEIKIGPDARNIYKNINECNSFEGIVKRFPKSYITLFLHAYQSYLWNNMATERIKLYGYKPAVGDLVLKKRKDGKKDKKVKYMVLTERNIQYYEITDVVLPLISRQSMFPENKVKDVVMEAMKKDEITLNNFAKTKKLSNISGSYRKLVEKADLIDIKRDGTNLELEFNLKSSTYATMFIREIMRNDRIA
eukprot:GAHX01001256.1.p1 GENE.GAHX01001256.1~~GAHX01001256.1.p1  ORF type:complete len:679 (+),score=174.53 GAHX01001256.1:40-2037(+)